jgi:hypothetical protein
MYTSGEMASYEPDRENFYTMPIMDATIIWAAVGALGTVAAAGVAAWAARQSHNAAIEASAAAGSLAAIERGRRHDELAPEFELTFAETGPNSANLRVALAGGGLESLDEVTFTILDETGEDRWAGGLPGGLTQEQAEAFVWGPWEFNAMAAHQVVSNRESRPHPYSRVSGKNWDLLPLRRTEPSQWMSTYSQQQWQAEYEDQPIRLLITCRRAGYEPWTLLHEVLAGPGPEERKQASEIRVQARTCDGGRAGVLPKEASKSVHMLVVVNESNRPIRNLAAQIEVIGPISPGTKRADVVGRIEQAHLSPTPTADVFVPMARSDRWDLLDAGENAAFVWSFDVETCPKVEFTIRFADDQEREWQVGPDLRPRRSLLRDW